MRTQPGTGNGHNSLAAFARHLGISPATARQWKRRGKVWQSADGCWAADRDSVTATVTKRDSKRDTARKSVTDRDSNRDSSRDSVTPESVTERDTVTAERDSLRDTVSRLRAELRHHKAELHGYKMQVAGRAIRLDTPLDLCPWCDKSKGECDGHGIVSDRLRSALEVAGIDSTVDLMPDWGA